MRQETLDQWVNPLVVNRADPYIMRHQDGYYYFTATVPEYDRIELRRSKTISGIKEAEAVTIWVQHDEGEMVNHIWAPEIHFVEEKWYIYFAAAHSEDQWRIRMYVLETDAENPMTGVWTEKGQIKTLWESFSLDATTFSYKGMRYLVWAQNDPDMGGNTNLYIDEMVNPWTLAGKQRLLTKPDLAWERIGYKVNEGPAILQIMDKVTGQCHIYMTYSVSATDFNYCMGLLKLVPGADPLQSANWEKASLPIFKTCEETGVYGPGHNSFTQTEDGRILMVYHARQYKYIEGEPLDDPNRHTRVQPIDVKDGELVFGTPVGDGAVCP